MWNVRALLSLARRFAEIPTVAPEAIAAAQGLLELDPNLDVREALRSAMGAEVSRASAVVVVLQAALEVLADGERDALTDEQLDRLGSLVRCLPGHEPGPLVPGWVVELVQEHLAQLERGDVRDVVVPTVVGDDGHEPTPSVGPVAGVTAPVVGAPGADTPGADVPTVGVPTDGLAEASPSAPAVPVEASGAAGAGAPPAAPERYSEWGQAAQQARNYARAWEVASGPLGGPGWLERRPRWLVLLCINLIAAAAGLGILWLVTR